MSASDLYQSVQYATEAAAQAASALARAERDFDVVSEDLDRKQREMVAARSAVVQALFDLQEQELNGD